MRAMVKPATELTSPCAAEATDQIIAATARPVRMPTRSVKAPMLA